MIDISQHVSNHSKPYNLNFRALSLRPELARVIAENYLIVGDWTLAKERVLASNASCGSGLQPLRASRLNSWQTRLPKIASL